MNVYTENSIYQVIGRGETIEAKKLSGLRQGERVSVGDVFVGNKLTLEIGRPMVLYNAKGTLTTSHVVSIEG